MSAFTFQIDQREKRIPHKREEVGKVFHSFWWIRLHNAFDTKNNKRKKHTHTLYSACRIVHFGVVCRLAALKSIYMQISHSHHWHWFCIKSQKEIVNMSQEDMQIRKLWSKKRPDHHFIKKKQQQKSGYRHRFAKTFHLPFKVWQQLQRRKVSFLRLSNQKYQWNLFNRSLI